MNHKGFTLIEMLLGMFIGGFVMVSALGILFHVGWGSIRSNDQIEALNDLSYATQLIKQDLQMAHYTNLTDGDPTPQSSLQLWWIDYTSFAAENQTTHSSTYTLSGTELHRNYDGTVMTLSRNITYLGFTMDDSVTTCTISASSSRVTERSKNLVFKVNTLTAGYE